MHSWWDSMTETDVIILEKYIESTIGQLKKLWKPNYSSTAKFKWSYGGGYGKMTESSVKEATNSLFA